MSKVFILWAKRTPIGAYGGIFSKLSAVDLGVELLTSLKKEIPKVTEICDEFILGNALPAGLGQAPGKQIIIRAGLPNSIQCCSVNKVCSSSLEAIRLGYELIKVGAAKCVIAGGIESMTHAPHLLKGLRFGIKFGSATVLDHMLFDGLLNPYDMKLMGECCEIGVKEYGFTREDLDSYALLSYRRAQDANSRGHFKNEIVPVIIDGKSLVEDEEPFRVDIQKIKSLKPSFLPDGSITAGNASTLADGASFVLIATLEVAKLLGVDPLVEILGFGRFGANPERFYSAPVGAILNACDNVGIKSRQVKVFEVNEAFSAVPLIVHKELDIPLDILNLRGGAVSLGHPIGASGSRIVTTLINVMKDFNLSLGCAAICNGGGEAVAGIFRLVNEG